MINNEKNFNKHNNNINNDIWLDILGKIWSQWWIDECALYSLVGLTWYYLLQLLSVSSNIICYNYWCYLLQILSVNSDITYYKYYQSLWYYNYYQSVHKPDDYSNLIVIRHCSWCYNLLQTSSMLSFLSCPFILLITAYSSCNDNPLC